MRFVNLHLSLDLGGEIDDADNGGDSGHEREIVSNSARLIVTAVIYRVPIRVEDPRGKREEW